MKAKPQEKPQVGITSPVGLLRRLWGVSVFANLGSRGGGFEPGQEIERKTGDRADSVTSRALLARGLMSPQAPPSLDYSASQGLGKAGPGRACKRTAWWCELHASGGVD